MRPALRELQGCVLFADLSGFTPLVTRAEKSAHGAERVQRILNAAFAPMTACIDGAGGEVLSFPGDAVLAVWTSDDPSELGREAVRAADCARRLLQLLHSQSFDPAAKLELRVALTCGELSVANVGGIADEWAILLCGEPVTQLPAALRAARPGEILLTGDVARAAGSRLRSRARNGYRLLDDVVPEPTSAPRPLAPAVSVEAVQPYVSRALRLRSDVGQMEWLSEFRSVTTLFVHVDGFSHVDAERLVELQETVQSVQDRVLHFDGTVNQIVNDDKGTIFVVAFGTAQHAHEDDAARAVSTALEIVAALEKSGVVCRAGIATGPVFTGTRGGDRRLELALVGSSVNLASRLASAADPILCDAATHALASQRLLFEARSTLRPEGRDDSVRVYAPLSRRPADDPSRVGIVGRGAERAVLDELLAELERSGASRLVQIDGSPGIGKSSLVQHIAQAAQTTSLRVLVGHADALESNTPYYPWRSVVAAMLGLGLSPSAAQLEARLAELLGPAVSGREALMNPVLPVSLEEGPLVSQLAAPARAAAFRQLLVDLTKQIAAASPLVLVFEDVHWLDEASVRMIRLLAHEVPGLLLVTTSRLEPTELRDLRDSGSTISLRLEELGREESLQILCRSLRVDTVSASLADLVYQRAEGHPLFTEQLAGALVGRQLVHIESGEASVYDTSAAADALRVPDSVNSVITSSIDRLPPEQQLVLKAAAVIGREFDIEALRATYPLDESSGVLERQLEELAEKELLVRVSEGRYRFRHALIQECVADLPSLDQRASLHGRIAEWLENTHAGDLRPFYARIAYHYESAGNLDKAIEYLDLGGTQALERDHSLNVAVEHLTRLLELDARRVDPTGPERVRIRAAVNTDTFSIRRARWERMLGDALIKGGRVLEGLPHVERSLTLLGRAFPPSRLRIARTLTLRSSRRLLLPPPAPRSRNHLPHARDALRETVAGYERYVLSFYVRGRALDAIACSLDALPIAEELGPSIQLCNQYAMFANVLSIVGQPRMARRYRELALQVAIDIGDARARSVVESMGSVHRLDRCEWEVRDSFDRALEFFDAAGDHHNFAVYAFAASRVPYALGEYEACEQLLRGALDHARAGRSRGQEVWALAGLGDLDFRRGRYDDARQLSEQALGIAQGPRGVDQGVIFQASGTLALVALRTGNHPAAIRQSETAFRALERGGWSNFTPQSGFMGLAETLLYRPDHPLDDADDQRRRLRTVLRRMWLFQTTRPTLRSLHRFYRARVWLQTGRVRSGARKLRGALQAAESFSMPFEAANAHAELSRCATVSASERERHRYLAGEIFARIGAEGELRRLDEMQSEGAPHV